ncbi:MAG TPA: ATP-binding protein, partial [Chthoniobacteraceae bacterium]|nr:ATP-binding protein [Chthoniobacteraceae bacterium]
GIQIDLQSDLPDVPPIAGNAAELREVLTNLIFNAVDAMPDGGVIRVVTSHVGNEVTIAVSDTGIGMTETERARCLEPFFTTKGEHGTGLGLAVVYGIIQRHGGAIEIQSQKGCGTTFLIRIPITAVEAATGPQSCPAVDRALRILVVDDQEIIAELVAEYLKADGHFTATAVDSSEALAVFSHGVFDLVITDQSMPGMNGMQLAAAIKQISPEVPVILLSGFGEEMLDLASNANCVDLLLGKPVCAADLRRALFQVTSAAEVHAAA